MHSQDDVNRFQRRLTISWIVMSVLTAIFLTPYVKGWLDSSITGDPRPVTARGDIAEFEKTSINVFQSARPSVVYINTKQRRLANRWTRKTVEVDSGTGSGFVWDKHGHIVTNYHVIKGASSAEVVFPDQSRFEARLIDVSPDHDLAVLKVDITADRLSPVLVGESTDLRVGQSVFAIGCPFGLEQTFSTGVVSARSRSILAQGNSGRTIEDVIQIDAAINPGNSGGPLLDSAGRLIGVNTAIYSPSGASAGIGFAVPVDTVNRVVPAIIARKELKPPQLGIGVSPYLNELVAARTGVKGIVISAVTPGGAAEAAGLRGIKEGNGGIILGDIVLKVGDEYVTSRNELLSILEHHKAGETITLTILREITEQAVDVTLQ